MTDTTKSFDQLASCFQEDIKHDLLIRSAQSMIIQIVLAPRENNIGKLAEIEECLKQMDYYQKNKAEIFKIK